MTSSRFQTDPLWNRGRDGTSLVAGVPTSFFRVTASGVAILDALESGGDLPPHHGPLTERLARAGAIHPVPTSSASVHDVTVVVPVLLRDPPSASRVARLVESLAPLRVIVVDDCSPVQIGEHLADGDRVSVVRLDQNLGPAGARNAGAMRVTTPIVVFIDADVEARLDDVLRLAAVVAEGSIAVAAPRVHSVSVDSLTGSYERTNSPLDMGPHPSVVKPGARVSYVPSAALACQTSTFRSIGGFDDDLRVGEDVDFVWRVYEGGLICRFVPSIEFHHTPRGSVRELVWQRFQYGTSAASLARRHGDLVTPFRSNILVALPGALLLLGFPLESMLAFIVAIGWLVGGMRSMSLSASTMVRLSVRAMDHSLSALARAIRREWWPVAFVTAPFIPRVAIACAAAVMVPLVVNVACARPRRAIRYSMLRVLDDLVYGCGVWVGAMRARSARCLTPSISLRRSPRASHSGDNAKA